MAQITQVKLEALEAAIQEWGIESDIYVLDWIPSEDSPYDHPYGVSIETNGNAGVVTFDAQNITLIKQQHSFFAANTKKAITALTNGRLFLNRDPKWSTSVVCNFNGWGLIKDTDGNVIGAYPITYMPLIDGVFSNWSRTYFYSAQGDGDYHKYGLGVLIDSISTPTKITQYFVFRYAD